MRETLMDIAQSGILAPSADNQHVFQIELGDTFIRLWPTQAFAANTARLRHALGLISLGAVVENMRLRANALGLSVNVTWTSTEPIAPLVQINFAPDTTTTADALAAAIPARCTNRRMYCGPAPTLSEAAQLDADTAAVDGVKLIWLTGAARKQALQLIWRAESERFLRQTLHEDIFSSVRFDLSWHETADTGLPPGSLEIEPPMRPLFKALRHWSLMQPMTWLGVHWLVGLRAGWLPAWQAPALGLLATALPLEQGAIQVGAAFERLWLRATLQDLALQPLAASAVLALQSDADNGASAVLRAALTAGWQEIAPGLMPLMVFRMGRAQAASVCSGRRPVDEYLQSKSSAKSKNMSGFFTFDLCKNWICTTTH